MSGAGRASVTSSGGAEPDSDVRRPLSPPPSSGRPLGSGAPNGAGGLKRRLHPDLDAAAADPGIARLSDAGAVSGAVAAPQFRLGSSAPSVGANSAGGGGSCAPGVFGARVKLKESDGLQGRARITVLFDRVRMSAAGRPRLLLHAIESACDLVRDLEKDLRHCDKRGYEAVSDNIFCGLMQMGEAVLRCIPQRIGGFIQRPGSPGDEIPNKLFAALSSTVSRLVVGDEIVCLAKYLCSLPPESTFIIDSIENVEIACKAAGVPKLFDTVMTWAHGTHAKVRADALS